MISAFIFFAHFLFILIIFTKKWQEESLGNAFINVALIILLFTIGWSISTTLTKFFTDSKGFGIHFDGDTISLTILSLAEFLFYRVYYKGKQITEDDKGK